MKKRSKTEDVMNHLRNKGRLSQLQCTELYSATRLSGIIFSKREQGYDIKTHDVTILDKYGKECTYAEYELISEPSEPKATKSKEKEPKQAEMPFDDFKDIDFTTPIEDEEKKAEDLFPNAIKIKKKNFWDRVSDWFGSDGQE
jgi:hypothetical protein